MIEFKYDIISYHLLMKAISFLFIIFLFGFISTASAQVDSEFWFAAPEVTYVHGDVPIYLRLTTYDKAANIEVDMPANSGFTKVTFSVSANSSQSVDLSTYLNLLENGTPNTTSNKGLHIVSDQNISAYYEVANKGNTDIFTLKGRNSLGTSFYTPFQTDFTNGSYSPVTAYSSIDIVATEDNTEIKIKPTNDVLGHVAGVEYTVTLNKGQTYSARAVGFTGSLHLQGTKVTSNRPIAVTIKDDSATSEDCHDLIGDQMVPVSIIGTDYIAVKGFLATTTQDRLYFLATKDQTKIYLNGSTTPSYTLDAGKQQALKLTDNSLYIHSSAPIYVFHVSGFGCEMGGAILPHISCTGSYDMSFTRTTDEYFGLVILVRNGSQDKFTLNGSTTAITASMFSEVPGTNKVWVSASIDLSSLVPTGTASRITNSEELFNLGVINGGAHTGCKYGYFSDYSSLNIGADRIICDGDSVQLDAQRKDYTYLWNTGATTQKIEAKKEGDYYVVVKKNQCVLSDTMHLFVNPKPKIFLGNDTNICIGKSIKLDAGSKFISYLWQNKAVSSSIVTDTTGRYWVKVTDTNECTNKDTINVTVRNYPKITLPDTVFCDTFKGIIKASVDQKGSAKWLSLGTNPITIQHPDSMASLLTVSKYDSYPLLFSSLSIYGCASTDTVVASFHPRPTASFTMDSSKCYQENVSLRYTGNASVNAAYYWSFDDCTVLSGDKQGPINVALGAAENDKLFKLYVYEGGCNSDTAKQILKVTPTFSMSSDTTAGCAPTRIQFYGSSKKADVSYLWNFGDNTSSSEQNPVHQYLKPQKYTVSLLLTALNGCQNAYSKKDMLTVYQVPNSQISLDASSCYPDSIPLTYKGNASDSANYSWTFNDILVTQGSGQGPYSLNIGSSVSLSLSLSVEENGCYSDTTKVKLKRIPHIDILTDPDGGCQPLTVNFDEKNKESGVKYAWDFADTHDNTSSIINPVHIFYNENVYPIKLTTTSGEGCVNSQTKQVMVYKKPDAAFTLNPKVALLDNATITFENLSKYGSSYQWSFGDSSKSTEKNPVYVYTTPGEFDVRLLVISENACKDTAYDHVTVGAFYAPNAFAPNSNVEKNRIFSPVSIGMTLSEYTFSIFNRWGNKIFETHDTSHAWDGKIDGGSEASSGAYVWTITYQDIRGNEHKYGGTVILLR